MEQRYHISWHGLYTRDNRSVFGSDSSKLQQITFITSNLSRGDSIHFVPTHTSIHKVAANFKAISNLIL
jgi:hypothetical protein